MNLEELLQAQLETQWVLFMARLSPLPAARDSELDDLSGAEDAVRQYIEAEGGRAVNLFWHGGFAELGPDAIVLEMIALFETRTQFPISRNGHISYELYVHPPAPGAREKPPAMNQEEMADAVRTAIDSSGRFVVTALERWDTSSSFEPWEEDEPDETWKWSGPEVTIWIPETDT